MIKNEVEYRITREHAENFERALAKILEDEEKKTVDPIRWQLHHDGIQSMLEEFQEQITEYEMLRDRNPKTPLTLHCEEIGRLPEILIKARMAAKISHQELAAMVGMSEAQIQEFEKHNYQTATFSQMFDVCLVLEVKLQRGEFLVELDKVDKTPFAEKRARFRQQVKTTG